MGRISVAGLIGLVVATALGFAGVVNASDLWRGVAYVLTISTLLASVLGAILRGWRGGGWLGFAAFGWGFFLMGFAHGTEDHLRQLSDPPSRWAFDRSNAPPAFLTPPTTPAQVRQYGVDLTSYRTRRANAGLIGHWLAVLLLGAVGAVLGQLLAPRVRVDREATPA